MKKIVSLLLVLAALASLAVMPVSAVTDRATAQKAIVQTALAYYYKELAVQYDSTTLTYQNKMQAGTCRISAGASPEEAAADNTVYTVCSDYCSDVYYDAFGYWLCGNPRVCTTQTMTAIPATSPEVVVKFGGTDGEKNRDAAVRRARAALQVGDIIVCHTGSAGHAMLYIGDVYGDGHEYIIHSGGGKIDLNSGIDVFEDYGIRFDGVRGGSIRMDDVDEHCFTKGNGSSNELYNTKWEVFSILRFMDAEDFPEVIAPKALCRLKWPGLEIDRSADRSIYNNVTEGEEMTVTVTIKNNGTGAYKSLPVTENAPNGASIVDGSANEGGAATAAGVSWSVDVPAGGEIKLTYKVKITAKQGQTVTLPAGAVDAIPSRELTFIVGATRIAEDAFSGIIDTGKVPGMAVSRKSQLGFANEFYKAVLGQDLGLPETMAEMLDGLFPVKTRLENVSATGGRMFTRETSPEGRFQTVSAMILPKHVWGRAFLFETDDACSYGAKDRILDLRADRYEPGDIFVGMRGRNVLSVENPNMVFVYIYLGDGMVLARSRTGKPVVTSFESTVQNMLRMNLAFALRPSLVG